MWRFLKEKRDEIASIAAIVGVVIGTLGFTFTVIQLSTTNETLKASNTYQIQKDSRAILDKLNENSDFRNAMKSGLSKENEEKFLDGLWAILNFYLSVFRQDKIHSVSKQFIMSFREDYCEFLQREAVKIGWEKLEQSERLSSAHAEMRSRWCEHA